MQIHTKEKMKRFREVMPPLEQFDSRLLIILIASTVILFGLVSISRMIPSIGSIGIFSKTLSCLGEFFFLGFFISFYLMLWQMIHPSLDLRTALKMLGRDIRNVLPVVPLYTFFVFLMLLTLIFVADGSGLGVFLRTTGCFAAIIIVWRMVYLRRKKKGYHHKALGLTVLFLILVCLTGVFLYFVGLDITRLVQDYTVGKQTAYVEFVEIEDYQRKHERNTSYTFLFRELENSAGEEETTEEYQIRLKVRESDIEEAKQMVTDDLLSVKEGTLTYYPNSKILVDFRENKQS